MTLETLLRKAIDNDWKPDGLKNISKEGIVFSLTKYRVIWKYKLDEDDREISLIESSITGIFLDPRFWKTISKIMNWPDKVLFNVSYHDTKYNDDHIIPYWQYQMYCLIDHLCNNGTIETFIKNIERR